MNFQGTGQNILRNEDQGRRRTSGLGRWSAAHPRFARIGWIAIGLVVLGGVIWAVQPTPAARNRGFNNLPEPVGVATAKLGDIQVALNELGTVTPLATAMVRPQVTGVLTKLNFTEGQMVKAGDVLAQIDPRPYQAALDQAKGNLARDQATLANDRVLAADQEGLWATNATSKESLDTAEAAVRSEAGTVATDQANVETAQINLSYTNVTAPVSGLVGLHQVDTGNVVSANQSNDLFVVTQMQPMSVLFNVPEDNVGEILTRMKSGASLSVSVYDRTDSHLIATGTLAAVDNEISQTTGSVQLRALFDNSNGQLYPSQFVNATLLVDTIRNQVVVPIPAIQHGADGAYVFVVSPDKTANETTVTVGAQDAKMVAITKGLQPGDVVVTDGADRLRDGALVSLPSANGQIAVPKPSAAAQGGARGAAVLVQVCGADIKKLCASEAPGRAQRTCLTQHQGDLSPACRSQMARAGGRGGRGGGGFGGGFGGGAP